MFVAGDNPTGTVQAVQHDAAAEMEQFGGA